MSCIRCGEVTEESAYLCEVCSETCFDNPVFFFSPNLIGESLVERLRNQAAALVRLGPVAGGDIERAKGQSFLSTIASFDIKKASEDDAQSFFKVSNFILGQYGVPLYADRPKLMLTDDAAKVISEVVRKINLASEAFARAAYSDLFLRIGLIYWTASRSVLLRAGSVKWCREKRRYALKKALDYLGRIPRNDDLFSLASKMSGFVLLDAGAYADAEQKLSNAKKSFPEDALLVRALAKAHFNLGNVDESLNLIDQALSLDESSDLLIEKGDYLRRSQRYDDAIASYQQAVSLDRKSLKAYKASIFLLKRLGRDDDAALIEADMKVALEPGAAADFEEMITAEKIMASESAAGLRARHEPVVRPSKPKIRIEDIPDISKAAQDAITSGDFDTAIELLKHHLSEKKERDLGALVLLGRAYLYNGQFEEANRTIDELLRHQKGSAAGWYWKAKIAYAQGRWGAAIQHLSKATTLLPTFVDAWVERGLIFLANEKFKDADESFEVALDLDPRDARAWLGRAKCMSKLNRWGASLQCIDRFLELMPNSHEGLLLKAELLLEKNRYQEAEMAFARYSEVEPKDSKAICKRAIALHSMGLIDDAVKCFEKCLEIDPSNDQARNWLKMIHGGKARG